MSFIKKWGNQFTLCFSRESKICADSFKSLYESYIKLHEQDEAYYNTITRIAFVSLFISVALYALIHGIHCNVKEIGYGAVGSLWSLLLWSLTENEKTEKRIALLKAIDMGFAKLEAESTTDDQHKTAISAGQPDYKALLMDVVKKYSLV